MHVIYPPDDALDAYEHIFPARFPKWDQHPANKFGPFHPAMITDEHRVITEKYKIEFHPQLHQHTCIIACLVMLTEIPYWDLLEIFGKVSYMRGADWDKSVQFLIQHGYDVDCTYGGSLGWTPTNLQLMEVEYQGFHSSHAVVAFGSGDVFDPLLDYPTKVHQYFHKKSVYHLRRSNNPTFKYI